MITALAVERLGRASDKGAAGSKGQTSVAETHRTPPRLQHRGTLIDPRSLDAVPRPSQSVRPVAVSKTAGRIQKRHFVKPPSNRPRPDSAQSKFKDWFDCRAYSDS